MTLAEFLVWTQTASLTLILGPSTLTLKRRPGRLFELDAYCYGIAFEVGLIKVGIRAARREAGQATRMDDFPFLVKGVAEGLGAHLDDLNRGVQATECADITNRWQGGDGLGGLGGGGLGSRALEFGALRCVGFGGGGCGLHRVDQDSSFSLGWCGGRWFWPQERRPVFGR